MFSFLCPKQFWTVHDETLYRSCRQTNFSEEGFVNKVPFIFLFFFISLSYHSLSSVSNVFFLSGSMLIWGGGVLIKQGRWVVNFSLIFLQNKILLFLIKYALLQ